MKVPRNFKKVANFYRTWLRNVRGCNIPETQAPTFPHGWLKISTSPKISPPAPPPPPIFRWITCGRLHKKSNVRKITHPSTIPTLTGLTLEFP